MEEVAYSPSEKINPNIAVPLDTTQKNLSDYLMKYGRRVCLRALSNGLGTWIYVVPEGKVLFLVSCSTSADIKAGDYAKIYIDGGINVVHQISCDAGSGIAYTNEVISSHFSIPLRINPNEKIVGESTSHAVHSIDGYEINLSDIYK